MHFENFVGLTKAIPGSIILAINIHCASVAFNGCVCVFHLDIFVAHQSPCRKKITVKG